MKRALIAAALLLSSCTVNDTQGAVNLANALKGSGVTGCLQSVAAYTPFSHSSCACVSNPADGEGATISVGTSQCTVTTQPKATSAVNISVAPGVTVTTPKP